MSFATEVKNELCRVPLSRHCCRKQQHELGITNTFEYIKAQVGTFVVLMMPGWMKEYSYKRFLRKSE